jgi:hypothetical protein
LFVIPQPFLFVIPQPFLFVIPQPFLFVIPRPFLSVIPQPFCLSFRSAAEESAFCLLLLLPLVVILPQSGRICFCF